MFGSYALQGFCYRGTNYPNVIFNKNLVQSLDSFYKLNEKEVPRSTVDSFIETCEIQPNTSDNEILKPFEEESRDFYKTPSKAIIDIYIYIYIYIYIFIII